MIKQQVLPNGTTIVTEHRPHALDFAFTIAVAVGSRDEAPGEYGAAHLLEHLTGRGSRQFRSSLKICRPLERAGGYSGAQTTLDATHYSGYVIAEHWRHVVDPLTDMVLYPLLRANDFALEQGIVIEEERGDRRQPSDRRLQRLHNLMFGRGPLGLPLGGNLADIRRLTIEGVRDFHHRFYVPRLTKIVAVGNLPSGLEDDLARRFGDRPDFDPPARSPAHYRADGVRHGVIRDPASQQEVILSFPAYSALDRRVPAVHVLSTALGENESSTMYQTLRDQHGFGYDVATNFTTYTDAGMFNLTAGLPHRRLPAWLKLAVGKLAEVKRHGLSQMDFLVARDSLVNSLTLGCQDSPSEASRLADDLCDGLPLMEITEVQDLLRRVTRRDVQEVARQVFRASQVRLLLDGPISDHRPYLDALAALGD